MGATNANSEDGRPDGEFQHFHRPSTGIRARQLDTPTEIGTADGTVVGKPGEWVIKDADGTRHVCSDDTFRETYRGATITANKALNQRE